jgi:hypothetical protein
MTPADWAAALTPGCLALILHVPAQARARRTSARLDAVARAKTRPAPPRPYGMGPDRSLGPVIYSFRHDDTGRIVQTVDQQQADRLLADPEWRAL